MHFLILGGAGFIGSHLVDQLLIEGHDVTVVDNLTTGRLENLPQSNNLKIIVKDVLECRLEDFTKPVHGIAHLAAIPSVEQSWLNPLGSHHHNLSTVVTAIELCQVLNCRLVFASSCAVYGNVTSLPIKEENDTNPISPYALQKLFSEKYIGMFSQRFGIPSISMRLFNVFGPRQIATSVYSGVISLFNNAMQKNMPIRIYGNGFQTRDFIYVLDVAEAFVKALTIPLLKENNFICNIASGKQTGILEVLNILKTYYPSWNEKVYFEDARIGDVINSYADVSKTKSFLDFQPQWTLESGLQNLLVIGHTNFL